MNRLAGIQLTTVPSFLYGDLPRHPGGLYQFSPIGRRLHA
jgi:hypothetical protein